MKNNVKVSLCMIVKNEEKVLEKCLESVKNYVDEMIIVDTGSIDKTKEIASNFGAKLYDFEWCNDFAKARQFAKEQATGDWILQLDADEYFLENEARKIKEVIMENEEELAFSIKIVNITGENQMGSTHTFSRIFKNLPELEYKYKIHEQITNKGEPIVTKTQDISIFHTGYTSETIKNKKKHERNLAIINEELKANPNDGFMHLNISNEYLTLGRYEETIEHSKKAFKFGKGRSYQSKAILNIIQALMSLKKYDDCLNVIKDAKDVFPFYTDINYLEGVILEKMGREEDAKNIYEECMKIGEANSNYLTKKGVGSIMPMEKIGILSLKQRNLDKAVEYLLALTPINKMNMESMVRVLNLLRRNMTDDEFIGYVNNIYSDENPNELLFKYQLMLKFRVKKGILLNLEKMKDRINVDGFDANFYNNLYSKNYQKVKQMISKNMKDRKKEALVKSVLYYIKTKDKEIKTLTNENKTVNLMFECIDGSISDTKKRKNYDEDIYLNVLRDLVAEKNYMEFEKLLNIEDLFSPNVYKEIGRIFYIHLDDALAIQYFTKYLSYNQNDKSVLKQLLRLLYSQQYYEEAVLFAQQLLSLDNNEFKAYEILIESLKQLGEKEAVQEVCEMAFEIFPESEYIINQMEIDF